MRGKGGKEERGKRKKRGGKGRKWRGRGKGKKGRGGGRGKKGGGEMREKGVNKGEGKERGEKRNAEILPEVSNSSQSLLISAPWVGAPANENKDPLPPPQTPLIRPKSADS